jgi:TonB family protein
MNTKSKLALSLGLLLAPLALKAADATEKAYVESYRNRAGGPIPTSVITPEVSSRFAGRQVVLEFVVDATGSPTDIRSATPGAHAELIASVSDAVARWKFSPALVDGKPVARKVALPVKIVANGYDGTRYALN